MTQLTSARSSSTWAEWIIACAAARRTRAHIAAPAHHDRVQSLDRLHQPRGGVAGGVAVQLGVGVAEGFAELGVAGAALDGAAVHPDRPRGRLHRAAGPQRGNQRQVGRVQPPGVRRGEGCRITH